MRASVLARYDLLPGSSGKMSVTVNTQQSTQPRVMASSNCGHKQKEFPNGINFQAHQIQIVFGAGRTWQLKILPGTAGTLASWRKSTLWYVTMQAKEPQNQLRQVQKVWTASLSCQNIEDNITIIQLTSIRTVFIFENCQNNRMSRSGWDRTKYLLLFKLLNVIY